MTVTMSVPVLVPALVPMLVPVVTIVTAAIIVVVPVTPFEASCVTALPAIDIEELTPGDSHVAPQWRMPIPVAERVITLQPAWHVPRSAHIDAWIIVVVRRCLVGVAYLLVRCGLGRVDQHEATGD